MNHYRFTSSLRSHYSYPVRKQKQVLQGEPVNTKQTITKQAALPIKHHFIHLFLLLVSLEKPCYLLVTQHLSVKGKVHWHLFGSHTQTSRPCAGTAVSSYTAAPAAHICASTAHLACFILISVSTQHLRRGGEERNRKDSVVSSKSKNNSLSSWEWQHNFVSRLVHFLRANQQTLTYLGNYLLKQENIKEPANSLHLFCSIAVINLMLSKHQSSS